MDVIIVCHTEFGYVHEKRVIFNKHPKGVEEGIPNLISLADKYKAKITFAVCPEVVDYFPAQIEHEIGLHIHPGCLQVEHQGYSTEVGDSFLHEHSPQILQR